MGVNNIGRRFSSVFTNMNAAQAGNGALPQMEPLMEPPDNVQPPEPQNPADVLSISKDAKEAAQETKKTPAQEMEEIWAQREILRKQMESAREQGEAAAAAFEEKRKCLLISMRIMNGDKVPPADHQYLAEKDPELYGKAILMRRIKEDPEEYDRLSEDEEEETPGVEPGAESGGAPRAQAAKSVSSQGGESASAEE